MKASSALSRVTVVTALLLALAPAPASARVTALGPDDAFPGASIAFATPPFGDSVNAVTDANDIWSLSLSGGDVLEVRVTRTGGSGAADLWLYPPGSTHTGNPTVDIAEGQIANYLQYEVPPAGGGAYYLDVYCPSGSADYDIEWSINGSRTMSGVERFWGADRYQTAIEISRQTFPDGTCPDVVIATGERFPDALAASGLAGVFGCPVLLTRTAALPTNGPGYPILEYELDRLGATDVWIIGGVGAVSDNVRTQLIAHFGGDPSAVHRIAGPDRYATARLVADEMQNQTLGGVSEAFVVPGDNWPDALAASPFAYANHIPILLTPRGSYYSGAEEFVSDYCSKVRIVGGAIDDDVENEILASAPGGYFHAGANRYQTAVTLVGNMTGYGTYANDWHRFGLATGDSFPDALGGGAAIGAKGGVLLLTRAPSGDSNLHTTVSGNLPGYLFHGDDAEIYGGEAAIGGIAEAQLRAIYQGLAP